MNVLLSWIVAKGGVVSHGPLLVVNANSVEEAEGIALRGIKEKYPVSEGYSHHNAIGQDYAEVLQGIEEA